MTKISNHVYKKEYPLTSVGIMDVIQINFIILKCFNLIDWSWWKVFIPLYISIGILLIAFLILGIYEYVCGDDL